LKKIWLLIWKYIKILIKKIKSIKKNQLNHKKN
jgi:hypothetical protein